MTKKHYCGFLYHPGSQQILLQQKPDTGVITWGLVEDLGKFHPKEILPVYDYVAKGKKCVVCYAEVKTIKNFPVARKEQFKWFTIKELSKLPMSPQTKQDVIVGRRVIDSQIRREAGEQTIG